MGHPTNLVHWSNHIYQNNPMLTYLLIMCGCFYWTMTAVGVTVVTIWLQNFNYFLSGFANFCCNLQFLLRSITVYCFLTNLHFSFLVTPISRTPQDLLTEVSPWKGKRAFALSAMIAAYIKYYSSLTQEH